VISSELESKWCDELYHTFQARFDYANKLHINDTALLFSQVTLSLSSDEIKTIASNIRLPNEVRDLALFSQTHQTTLSAEKPTSEAVFACFNQLDLWRRPERFEQVLKVLEISQQQPVSCFESLTKAAKQARAVSPQQFIAQGIKGAEIKTALEQARLEVINSYFS
jgi:tRNA nucleotidyltransferase (CCA-adding enzyme)